jgi:aminomethyltransferase
MTLSPLDDRHRALGAKITPFGGWDMPLSYPDGTLAEHRACRDGAVVFDVSHLGTLRVEGPGAKARLQWALTNDLNRIAPGRAQYTHLLDLADASVIDDIIVWWVGADRFDVMPNASNTDRVAAAIAEATAASGDDEVSAVDVTATRAVLAVQGPEARARLATVFADAAAVERFAVARLSWNGADAVVAGTGYTGEDGVEIAIAVHAAGELWDALIGAGVAPAGLGARDTLRLEAGLPLHGHELGPGITPLQAGLGWVVRWDKGDFRGRTALEAERDAGIARRLRGIVVEGRRPPRAGQQVVFDGAVVGEVTSGNFSPVLECGIAMAFVPPELAEGAEVGIDVRGDLVTGRIVAMPFVR